MGTYVLTAEAAEGEEETLAVALEGGQVGPPLVGVLQGPMLGPVIGIVALATVGPTTLPAGLAASSVGPTKRKLAVVIAWAVHVEDFPLVASAVAVAVPLPAAQAGNPVTGFALGNASPRTPSLFQILLIFVHMQCMV